MLHALNEIASQQSIRSEQTIKPMFLFLDCAATHSDAEKVLKASDMMLTVDSDAKSFAAPIGNSELGDSTGRVTWMAACQMDQRVILEELRFPQPAALVKTAN